LSLKAEQFLRVRQELIAMQEQIMEAAGTLDEAWKAFDENNQALNAELVKSADDYKNKLTSWAEVAGNAADVFSQAIGGGSGMLGTALTVIKNVGKTPKYCAPHWKLHI
jgi:hypothetical protein